VSDTIDPEVLEAYVPKGVGVVPRHPCFKEIIDRLLSGWMPRQIENWLITDQREPYLTASQIYDYAREHISATLLTQDSYLRRRFRYQSVQINELDLFQQLISAQTERVSRLMEQEERNHERQQGPNYNPYISREVRALGGLLKDSAALKIELRMLQPADAAAQERLRTGVEIESTPVEVVDVETIDPARVERLLQLANLLERVEMQPPQQRSLAPAQLHRRNGEEN
jgi:hypothetical protein